MVTLEGLMASTVYYIHVAAVTSEGYGPMLKHDVVVKTKGITLSTLSKSMMNIIE